MKNIMLLIIITLLSGLSISCETMQSRPNPYAMQMLSDFVKPRQRVYTPPVQYNNEPVRVIIQEPNPLRPIQPYGR